MVVDLVLIGLAMALDPLALTIFILLLASEHGPRKGFGFIIGWLAALAAVAAVTVLATGNTPPASGTAPSLGILVFKIVLGIVLLAIAERQRRRMGKPRPPKKEPKWQARLDEMSSIFAAGLGAFFQPSVFVVTAAATLTDAHLSSVADYGVLILFGLLSVSSYLSMTIYVLVRSEKSRQLLTGLKGWLDRHTDVIIIVISAAVGLWLVGKSSYLLAT